MLLCHVWLAYNLMLCLLGLLLRLLLLHLMWHAGYALLIGLCMLLTVLAVNTVFGHIRFIF